MNQRVIASGWGQTSPLAADFPALTAAIAARRTVVGQPWFDSEKAWQDLRLNASPYSVPDAQPVASPFKRLQPAIAEALAMASLQVTDFQGQRVRVYLAGSGMRADVGDFAGYQDRNDSEDLLFFPAIKQLHASSYGQDRLAHQLVEQFALCWPPTSMYSASNSALASLHLAQATIAAGQADLVLIVGWMEVMLQDVAFMGGQGMLGAGKSQPFSDHDNSVLPANGAVALVLESKSHARQRGFTPAITVSSSVCCQSSGERGGSSFTADFRTIAHTLENALLAAELTPNDIACAIPHANGIIAGDKVEAMALQKVWGKHGVPVVSYKGQIGYVTTCSGALDFMLAADALLQRRLLALTSRAPIDASLQIAVHADCDPLPLEKTHIIKFGIGLEGSVIAMVISACQEGTHEAK